MVPTTSAIVGSVVFAGTLLATAGEGLDVPVPLPSELVPVTTTFSVFPTSADVGAKIFAVAPGMSGRRPRWARSAATGR